MKKQFSFAIIITTIALLVMVQGARAWNFFGGQPPAKETSAPAQVEHYYLPIVVRPSTGGPTATPVATLAAFTPTPTATEEATATETALPPTVTNTPIPPTPTNTPPPVSGDILLTNAPDIWFGMWFPGQAITRFTSACGGGQCWLTAYTAGGQSQDILTTTRTDMFFGDFNPGVAITGFTSACGGGQCWLTAHAANGDSADIIYSTAPNVWFGDFNPGQPMIGFDSYTSGGYLYLRFWSQ